MCPFAPQLRLASFHELLRQVEPQPCPMQAIVYVEPPPRVCFPPSSLPSLPFLP